jgi:putative FmdB family regulatory protein
MPTYDYVCRSCEKEFEIFQSIVDDRLTDCPKCSAPALERLIGVGAGIIFKGSGFYETDYKRQSKSNEDSSSEGSPKSDGESGKTEKAGSESESGSTGAKSESSTAGSKSESASSGSTVGKESKKSGKE